MYAKTLYKPTRPKHINDFIRAYTKEKVPHFFLYAKDHSKNQVSAINDSIVNKLERIIVNKRFKFKEFAKFDYKKLMQNPQIKLDDDLISEYIKLNRAYHFKVNMENPQKVNIQYISKEIRSALSQFGHTDNEIVDMLVKYLYHIKNSDSKASLWFCYGDIILKNLELNVDKSMVPCMKCGKRFERKISNQQYCESCREIKHQDYREVKCVDCGKIFRVNKNNRKTIRCNECQAEHIKAYDRERKR